MQFSNSEVIVATFILLSKFFQKRNNWSKATNPLTLMVLDSTTSLLAQTALLEFMMPWKLIRGVREFMRSICMLILWTHKFVCSPALEFSWTLSKPFLLIQRCFSWMKVQRKGVQLGVSATMSLKYLSRGLKLWETIWEKLMEFKKELEQK